MQQIQIVRYLNLYTKSWLELDPETQFLIRKETDQIEKSLTEIQTNQSPLSVFVCSVLVLQMAITMKV